MSFAYMMRGKPSEILGVEVDQRLQELAGKFALAWKLQGSPRPSPEVMERELVGGKGKAAFWPRMRDLLAWHQEVWSPAATSQSSTCRARPSRAGKHAL